MTASRKTDTPSTDIQPWYRQFWPWFLIGILAFAVVIGLLVDLGSTGGAERQRRRRYD